MAGYAAMRDAAAKFLTQFPGLDVAKPLLASKAIMPKETPLPGSAEAVAAAADLTIEAVPINDTPVAATQTPASAPPASAPPSTPPPSNFRSSSAPLNQMTSLPATSLL